MSGGAALTTKSAPASAAPGSGEHTAATRRRPPWWPFAARVLAAALLAASATVLVLQADVSGADGRNRSCGSPFDVIAGRADWQQWRVQDIADAAPAGLVRTASCPSAVNERTAVAGALTIASAVFFGAAAVGRRSSLVLAARKRSSAARRRLRRLGTAATATGAVLSTGGFIGLLVLVANPDSTVFLYASRPAVLLIGLALLQPGVLLLLSGLAITALARGDLEDEPAASER